MEPTISTCTGDQVQCLQSSIANICVSINLNDFNPAIDYFEIDWDDDTENTRIEFGQSIVDISHEYDLNQFFNSCDFSNDDFTIKLKTYLVAGGIPLNNAFSPTFLNPPRTVFTLTPSTICVGDETCLDLSKSCPTNNYEIVSINYGDGQSDLTGCHVYENVGTYQVSVTLRNECDVSTTTQTLSVIEVPVAKVTALTGFVAGNNDPYIVCLGNQIDLDGDSLSSNESTYEWKVLNANTSNYQWIRDDEINDNTPNIPDIGLLFTKPGVFQVGLEVNNACNKKDIDTLVFEVIDASAFTLTPQIDGCSSLEYTPNPIEEGVTYEIDGVLTNDFPVTLSVGQHIVKATNPSNVCVSGAIIDTFAVLAIQQAQISTQDTTICSVDGMVQLAASPTQAEWYIDGVLFDGVLNPDNLEAGTHLITYGLTPCVAFDTIQITIIKAGIAFDGVRNFCLEDAPTTISVQPTGGTFSGNGIDANGLFNPQLAGEGMHTIYYELDSNIPSCSNVDSLIVTVASLVVDFELASCDGLTLDFTITEASSNFDQIAWEFGDGNSSTQAKPSHTFASAQTYPVKVTITQNGCTATMERNITIAETPVAAFTLAYDTASCAILTVAATNNSTGSDLTYLWIFGNGDSAFVPNPPTFSFDAIDRDTVFEVSLMVKNDCAISIFTEEVIVKARARAFFGTEFDSYCSGAPILASNNAQGNPTSYQWLKNGVVIGTDSLPPMFQHFTETTDSIELCLVVENACAKNTFCKKVVIQPTDVKAFFNTSDTIVCAGEQVCFTNLSNTNQVIFDLGDGTFTDSITICHTYSEPGIYQANLQAFGCGVSVKNRRIEVKAKPNITIASNDFGCLREVIDFNAVTEDATIQKYDWNFGDGTTGFLSSTTHPYDSAGNYQVCLMVTSTNECVAEVCKEITIPDLPTAGFTTQDDLLCVGDTLKINNAAGIATSICNYNFGDGNFSAQCAPNYVYPIAGNYIIEQVISNSLGCTDTFRQPILIRSLPEPNFEIASLATCDSLPINFTNLSTNANSYQWGFGNNNSSNLTAPSTIFEQAGNYMVNLTAIKDGLCSATITKEITISTTPKAAIQLSQTTACVGQDLEFVSPSTNNTTTVSWIFGDETAAFNAISLHNYAQAGTYSITVIQQNAVCSDTAKTTIEVTNTPEFSASIESVNCTGEENGRIALNAISGKAPYAYSWQNGVTTPTATNLAAGDYLVTVTDANRCQWSAELNVREPGPVTATVLQQTKVSCKGGTDGLLSIEINGGLPDYELLWSNEVTTNTLTNLSAGNYDLTVTDANNCQENITFEIIENEALTWENGITDISCFGTSDGIIDLQTASGGIPAYEGQILELGAEKRTFFNNLPAGNYTLEITDKIGCSNTFQASIKEPSPIWVAIANPNQQIRQGTVIELTTNNNVANPIFDWTPTEGLSCTDCANPIISTLESIAYQVIIEDETGCTATDSVLIEVDIERGIAIPEAFSPDGDGYNDKFYPMANNPGIETINSFRIYDRWGGLLHEALDFPVSDAQYGWDGTDKGKTVQPGHYVYRMVIAYKDGFLKEKHGTVLLIR